MACSKAEASSGLRAGAHDGAHGAHDAQVRRCAPRSRARWRRRRSQPSAEASCAPWLRHSSHTARSGLGLARVVRLFVWPRHANGILSTTPLDPCACEMSAQGGNKRTACGATLRVVAVVVEGAKLLQLCRAPPVVRHWRLQHNRSPKRHVKTAHRIELARTRRLTPCLRAPSSWGRGRASTTKLGRTGRGRRKAPAAWASAPSAPSSPPSAGRDSGGGGAGGGGCGGTWRPPRGPSPAC